MVKANGNILFVVNPISGGNDKSELIGYLKEFALSNNLTYSVFYTTELKGLENLKLAINNVKPEIIAAVGGDGTCNLVANAIINSKTAMAIIPLGSANGLATALDIPKDYEEALDLLVSGRIKLIDTILINDKICLHISDIGLNARVIKRFEEEKIRGFYGYAKQFFKELWEARPSRFIFVLENGKTIKKKAHVVAIANASKYGTGALINPNGKMDDGKFEIVIVKPYPFFALFSIMAAIFLGYADKVKYVEINSYRKIKIMKKKTQPLHIDGEIMEESTVVEVVINPASLRVIVP
ncbi:MAG: diacylglycerol kinase family lipid kinase [Bacteroidetes bacterium]|nr:diacylglycerol kinase family lipid kinase [Bacteroidota bacterium]